MMAQRSLLRDERGAGAAEFALILPLFLLFLLGIIDAGRFIWEVNQAEKATQMGARFAAVTNMVPAGLIDYSFSVSCGVPQGSPVPIEKFGGSSCTDNGSTATCSLVSTGCTGLSANPSHANFQAIVDRMQQIYPLISEPNVQIDYSPSRALDSLGFAGDPNGPDVAPIVTVSLRNLTFQPMTLMLFGVTIPMPSASYSITMEDGQDTHSN